MIQPETRDNNVLGIKSSFAGSSIRCRCEIYDLIMFANCNIRFLFKRILVFGIMAIVGMIFFGNTAFGWERTTHREITDKAIETKEAELNTYLVDKLGLEEGLNTLVDGKTAREWMIKGSDLEDGVSDFSTRPRNHFYEPIANRGLAVGKSAIEWSFELMRAQDGEDSYSWNDAREYYFKALTSTTKTERDKFWGKTFRSLGQVMHLLQDSANPAHVRDDPHIAPFGIGDKDGLHDYMARKSVASYYTGGGLFSPNPSLLQTPHTGGSPPDPLANLFDTNSYTGNNPGTTLGVNIGLTEFTSANFFSDDTIPGQSGTFLPLYPNAFELVPAVVPLPYLTLPRLGSAAFPAARAAKLTGNQAAAKFLLTHTHFDLIGKLELDNGVYEAQSQSLIPRAVDYSAAVLAYFLRGNIPLHKDKDAYEYVIARHYVGGPLDEEGYLDINFDIPRDVAFEGNTYLYLDLPGGQRILGAESFWGEYYRPFMATYPNGAINFVLSASIPRAQLEQSFKWTIVWEGKGGPGAQEPRIIIGQTGMATWRQICVC